MSYLPIYLDAGLSLADKFSLSGEMLLRGMGTVFMVLVILWGCLSLFKVFSAPEKPAKAPKAEAAKPAPKEEKKTVPAPAPAEPAPAPVQTDDAAVIAAICAALKRIVPKKVYPDFLTVSFPSSVRTDAKAGPAETKTDLNFIHV